jgi:phosphoserine aminotransferase
MRQSYLVYLDNETVYGVEAKTPSQAQKLALNLGDRTHSIRIELHTAPAESIAWQYENTNGQWVRVSNHLL